MNIAETEIKKDEEIQIRLDYNIIILKIESTGSIMTNLGELCYYPTETDFVIKNYDADSNKNKILIKYYKYDIQDIQNVQKLYFFLIGLVQKIDVYNVEQQSLLIHLIVSICIKQFKGQEAMDFVSKIPNQQAYILYLFLAVQFDNCLRAKDACLCLLNAFKSYYNTQNEIFVNQIKQLQRMPNNNDYFDMYVLLLQHKDKFITMMKCFYKESVPLLFETQKHVTLIHLLMILAKYDFYNSFTEYDNTCFDIIQNYMLNTTYINNTNIQKEVQELLLIICQQIPSLKLEQLIELLYYIQLKNCDQGIYSVILSAVVVQVSDKCQQNRDQCSNLLRSFSKHKMLLIVSQLQQKLIFYIDNLQIHNSLKICISIIRLISVMNYNIVNVINTLIGNFWSRNQYELQDINDQKVRVVKHLNKSFTDDILLYQFLLTQYLQYQKVSNYLEMQNTIQENQNEIIQPQMFSDYDQNLIVIIRDFYTSILHSFNVEAQKTLKQKQTQLQEVTGLNIGQIFYVANSIYEFCFVYCQQAAIWWLEEYYFKNTIEFYKQYCGSDALVHQVYQSLSDYCSLKSINIENYKYDIPITITQLNTQIKWNILFDFLQSLSQWIEYQLCTLYFDVIALICNIFKYAVKDSDFNANLLLDTLLKCIVKMSQNQLVETYHIKLLIYLCIQCSDGSTDVFFDLLKKIQAYSKFIEIQYIYKVISLYLQGLSELWIKQNNYQTNIETDNIVNALVPFLVQQSSKLFGERGYIWFAKCFKTVKQWVNVQNKQTDINVLEQQLLDIIQSAPPIFYKELQNNNQDNLENQSIDLRVEQHEKQNKSDLQQKDETKQKSKNKQDNNTRLILNISTDYPYEYINNFVQVKDLDDFPQYTQADAILSLVKCPGIPFTYLFPHPTAKPEANRLKSLKIDGIQSTENLKDDTQDNTSIDDKATDNTSCFNHYQSNPNQIQIYDDFSITSPYFSGNKQLRSPNHSTEVNFEQIGTIKIINMTKQTHNLQKDEDYNSLSVQNHAIIQPNVYKSSPVSGFNQIDADKIKLQRHWSAGGTWDEYKGESIINQEYFIPPDKVQLHSDDMGYLKLFKDEDKQQDYKQQNDIYDQFIITLPDKNENEWEEKQINNIEIKPQQQTHALTLDDDWSEEDVEEEDLMKAVDLDTIL